jgi:membrane associated rhomboid family serine protease
MNETWRPAREPILNVPGAVTGLAAAFVAIHLLRTMVLDTEQDTEVLLLFAFFPIRYSPDLLQGYVFPGGVAADAWTFVTYAGLHGGWTHLVVNCIWLLAFGSAVARRFGFLRFLAFSAVCAAAGALVHLATHAGSEIPVVGASAAISGQMAAAARFAFQPGGPLSRHQRGRGQAAFVQPAATLTEMWRDPTVLAFLGIWLGVNVAFGLAALPFAGGDGGDIAWQAHIGGLLAGVFLFPLFDPVGRHRPT